MANITGASNERTFAITKWLGLNESPDGDTKLKYGEAAAMRNFRISRDGNLQKRPGSNALLTLGTTAVTGAWNGFINGTEYVIAVCGTNVCSCSFGSTNSHTVIGTLTTAPTKVHMFGFDGKMYMLTGDGYYCYDGTTFAEVEGYVPMVATAVPPAGGGSLLEGINKLNGKRRIQFSPDGTATVFQLPEKGMTSIDSVKGTATGEEMTGYTVNTTDGTVTFTAAPAVGVNSIEVAWTMPTTFRAQIEGMRFSELYNGSQDTRVFLYGDGSNKTLYSDVDYDGKPRADYFPDLNEIAVGESNTPITGLIRHYSRLACFKSDSTWSIQYGLITLADSTQTAAFYVTPVNRDIGNCAMGQVCLVLNSPRTLDGADVYEWKNNSSYSANLSVDERQAKRISDRIYATLQSFTLKDCLCIDDNYHQEYYIVCGDKALIHNYAFDAWYTYDNFKAKCLFCFDNDLYFGTADGKINRVSTDYPYDTYAGEHEDIDCYWESGAMSFGQDNMRKCSSVLWMGIKPDSSSKLTVTVQTDKSSTYTEKLVENSLATFAHANFTHWTFKTNRKPQIKKLKIKAKKFVFYKLILKADNGDAFVTVTSADLRVRYTGFSK